MELNVLKSQPPAFNLDDICAAVADAVSKQTISQGGNPISKEDIADTFNGSSLSAITERHLAGITKGNHIGGKQTNYDVHLATKASVDHWAKKLEQRNMVKSSNLGPSTTAGHRRHFEIEKAISKWNDCDSLIVYDLNSDPKNIDIYEVPAKLVMGLWQLNVIGTEVIIKEIRQGYRSAMVTYNRFKQLFPLEDYRFIITDHHKMENETSEYCWRKAQERGYKLKPCKKTFNFDAVDFGDII